MPTADKGLLEAAGDLRPAELHHLLDVEDLWRWCGRVGAWCPGGEERAILLQFRGLLGLRQGPPGPVRGREEGVFVP